MAVAAEYIQTETFDEIISQEYWRPLVVAVPELESDHYNRQQAARFIGSVMADHTVELTPMVEKPIESLYDALHQAAAGDAEARKVVEINAGTDVVERTLKTGHISAKIPLTVTGTGKIIQHRQSMDSIQANSLRFAADNPLMRERTEAETRNAIRMEQLYRDGWFDEYSLLVVSRAENLPGVFFTETMSCSLQLTTKDGEGLTSEPAFVSGIAEGVQHDEQTVVELGKLLGVDYSGKSAAEVLDTPLLVHNSLVPNGVVDIVKLYDEAAGATFFGEDKPQQDYLTYRETCRQREQAFQPKVEKIVDELIAEAPMIFSPAHAVLRLGKISGKHMVEHAMTDRTIDARVFGGEAAALIDQGRVLFEQGRFEQLQRITEQAVKVERSVSCPSSMNGEGTDKDAGSDKYGSLEFECPKCKSTITRSPGKLIPRCKSCGADVSC